MRRLASALSALLAILPQMALAQACPPRGDLDTLNRYTGVIDSVQDYHQWTGSPVQGVTMLGVPVDYMFAEWSDEPWEIINKHQPPQGGAIKHFWFLLRADAVTVDGRPREPVAIRRKFTALYPDASCAGHESEEYTCEYGTADGHYTPTGTALNEASLDDGSLILNLGDGRNFAGGKAAAMQSDRAAQEKAIFLSCDYDN